LKVTPRTDTLGDVTVEYDPQKHPVPKPCHLHLRWAKETCPKCGSALIMYYAPTVKHRVGKFALTSKEAHPFVIVSCVECGYFGTAKGPSVIIDDSGRKDKSR
jgi:predicted nucleic-acid-binding Zn-ribbon protein